MKLARPQNAHPAIPRGTHTTFNTHTSVVEKVERAIIPPLRGVFLKSKNGITLFSRSRFFQDLARYFCGAEQHHPGPPQGGNFQSPLQQRSATLAIFFLLLLVHVAQPQQPTHGVPRAAANPNTFTFVRVEWQGERYGFSGRGNGPLWAHDFPTAEQNLYTAINALTSLPLNYEYKTIALHDEAIFDFPFLYICEVGYWTPNAQEIAILSEYMQRGGFLLVDDFRGGFEWRNFAAQMQRIVPHEPRPLELTHPIFHCFFEFERLGEHSPYWNMTPQYYGIFDDKGRIMAMINYNNDIGDGWEWPESDEVFSMEAFKLGINYLVYAMTH